jgi:hypothetical protein
MYWAETHVVFWRGNVCVGSNAVLAIASDVCPFNLQLWTKSDEINYFCSGPCSDICPWWGGQVGCQKTDMAAHWMVPGIGMA